MSNDYSEKTFLVVDSGLFFGLAQQLARCGVGKVLFHNPEWERGFPSLKDGCIGDGFDDVTCALDLWAAVHMADVVCFPDIQHAGLQATIKQQGKLVWGSFYGDELEIDRELFLETLRDVGLDVPEFKKVTGLSKLRDYLSREPDSYVKISRWRADLETVNRKTWELWQPELDALARRFGPLQDRVPFLVFTPIDAEAEVGYDGYFAGGKFPGRSLWGIENKDTCYVGTVTEWGNLPDQVQQVNEAFAPVLAGYGYTNFWSTEIRVRGKEAFFIDPTCRLGYPSGDAQLISYANLPDIIWAAAEGECIDPEPSQPFIVQALIVHKGEDSEWRLIDIPQDAYDWTRLIRPTRVAKTLYSLPPTANACELVGSVLGQGKTLRAAITHLKRNVALLEHNPIHVNVDGLYDVLVDLEDLDQKGVEFADKLPPPESVLEK